MPAWFPMSTSRHRRGVIAVQFAMMSTVVFGFAALVVDVGMLYNTKADLQRAADAAALAGASAYFSDAGLRQDEYELVALITNRAQQFSMQNTTLGKSTILDVADIAFGTHDFDNPTGALLGTGPVDAVQVTVRRAPDSANGAVPFLFAGIFGLREGAVTATARAVANDRLSGYQAGYGPPLLPITIDVNVYDNMVANGPDEFSYDNGVTATGDGIREVQLYPSDEGPGNFGLLDFQGVSASETISLIQTGVSAADVETRAGTSEITYSDELCSSTAHQLPGTPGLKASIEGAIELYIGELVAVFVHDQASGEGSNFIYRNVGIRVGRIMYVDLNSTNKRVVLQPAAYVGANVKVGKCATQSTGGQLGRIMLVQ